MSKLNTFQIFSFTFLIFIICSCKKQEDYLSKPGSYTTIGIVNNSVLASNVGIKYQGEPFVSGGTVLTGKGMFTFYDKRTGNILLEKELDIKKDDQEPYYLFQPDSAIAPQLIRNTQLNEPAPPDGYFKLKLVNLAKKLLPYQKVDVILYSQNDIDYTFAPFDTLQSVGTDFNNAQYFLVKRAASSIGYTYGFINHDTQQPILDNAGNTYTFAAGFDIQPINTYYFTEQETFPNDLFILKENIYYNIIPNPLFQ